MGLPNDPAATSLFVDSYGWEFSRDIEPTATYGRLVLVSIRSITRFPSFLTLATFGELQGN